MTRLLLLLGVGLVVVELWFWVEAHWLSVRFNTDTIYIDLIGNRRYLCFDDAPSHPQGGTVGATHPLLIVEPLALKATVVPAIEYGGAVLMQVYIATGEAIPVPVDRTLYAGLPTCEGKDLFELATAEKKS